MKRIILILTFILIASTANATYTWETWESGDFGNLDLNTDEAFEVNGGEGFRLRLFFNSIAIIDNTNATGIYEIVTHDNSTLFLNGGNIIKLTSSQIPPLSNPELPPVDPEHVFITCRNYSYNETTGFLSGTWENWDTFNIELISGNGLPVMKNIDFTIVPEPASLVLLGLGCLALRKRRK